jgi:transcriptional regulator of acetoin/glycerol metabolism
MIYFIQQGIDGPVKIGFTENIEKRISSLQTASPHKLRLIGSIDGDAEKERQLHNFFSAYRLAGEWFSPDRTMFDYIFMAVTGCNASAHAGINLREEVARTERRVIEKAISETSGNVSEAAVLLGITRPTLYSKLKEHGLLQKLSQ